jgi:pyrroloquinoline quinone (PQQ) biosynthesis protein C
VNARNSLYAALLDIAKDAVHRLDAHHVGGRLVQGTLPGPLYAAYLTDVVRQIRRSAPMLQAASHHFERQGRPALAALFGGKAGEEDGHDQWALEDLAVLGVSRDSVEATPPSRAVDAYLAWAAYCAHQAPAGVLGIAWVLEWFGYARAGRAAENLVAHSGIPGIESAVKFLRGHGDADRGHIEALAAALGHVSDPGEMALVRLSARITATLYLGMFDMQEYDPGRQPRHFRDCVVLSNN